MKIYYTQINVDNVKYFIASTAKRLVFVGSPNCELDEINAFYKDGELIENVAQNQQAAQQITEYLSGQRSKINLEVDFVTGTALQQKVWRALSEIPRGTTVNYAQLAKNVDHPKAIRAVATAVGKNPVMIVIPCHRVIRKDGSIGQFRGGVALKKKLLTIEGFLKDC